MATPSDQQQPDGVPSDTADLPLAEAASEILEIERSAPLDGEFAIELGDTFTQPDVRAKYARQQHTASVSNYRLRNVTLDASTMLLLRGRRRIPETRYLIPDAAYAGTLTKPLHPADLDSAEHYVIGSNRAWHNYYHWLIQAVPAIDASLRHANHRRVTLVLPPSPQPWQSETLALLGHQDLPRLILNASGHYLLHSAEFSEYLGGQFPGQVSRAAMATYRRMSQSVPWPPNAAEEIYVARTDAGHRVMENEVRLIDALQRQGVRVIVPGTLSVSDQIAAFRAAHLVIGAHGAGLSNLVFCRSGSFVYELLSDHYPRVSFNRIAQAAGLNYAADMFESFGDGDPHGRAWRVDLDLLATRLDAIRKRIAATPRAESAMHFLRRTQMAHPDEVAAPMRAAKPEVVADEPPRPGLLARMARMISRGGGR